MWPQLTRAPETSHLPLRAHEQYTSRGRPRVHVMLNEVPPAPNAGLPYAS
jgi:hypothetical protein